MTTIDPTTTAPTTAPAATATNTLSIVSVVIGVAGILLGQWLLSAAAIVFGFIARSKEPGAVTTANWGLVLGFVGAFGGLILGALAIFGVAPLFLFGGLGLIPFFGW